MRTLGMLVLATSVALGSGCVELEGPDDGVTEVDDTTPTPKIMLNKIMLNKIMLNALTGVSTYLEMLVNSPLDTATFAGPLGEALADADALELMPYLVSCALGEANEPVLWDDPWGITGSHTWHGGAGLCPEWGTSAPSTQCLELVSACLLARENTEGISVATSQRGQYAGGDAFDLETRVHAKPSGPDGALIASYQPCKETTPGAARDCGWVAEQSWVGVCTPGAGVKLTCSTKSSSVLRVCEGVGACDHADAVVERDNVCKSPSAIACPAGGTYVAMVGPTRGPAAATVPTTEFSVGLTASAGSFPASERQAFAVREGHFYGSLFEPGSYADTIHIVVDTSGSVPVVTKTLGLAGLPQPVFGKAAVCADHGWDTPDAYMAHRLCAQLEFDNATVNGCVAEYVDLCNAVESNDVTNLCASVDGGPVLGDGDFDTCSDKVGTVWDNGITVFLNQPCDLMRSLGSLCDRH